MRNLLVAALVALPVLAACTANVDDADTSESEVIQGQPCLPTLACAAPAGPVAPKRAWRHPLKSRLASRAGAANHRGRDVFVNPGAPQTVIAKLAYGVGDKDLEDEEVDVYVQRDCASDWEKLGTAITTGESKPHPPIEGVPHANGRVYFEIPAAKRLGLGRHRVRLVVAGDGTSTDLFIDVVPPNTPFFVSDVDGTLTSSEHVEFVKLLTGDLPDTHPGAPEALRALAQKGYRPMYVTARPEWLVQRTRDFLDKHGFPPGIVHTSTSITGAGFGASAAGFKEGELAMLAEKGLVPSFGFGNMPSDSQAYAPIQPEEHRIFYQITGEYSGRRIDSYNELLPGFSALPAVCK